MKTLAALTALLLLGATAARADEPAVETDVIVPPSIKEGAPGVRATPAMRHQHHRYRYRYALPARGTMLPGVLGMDLGGPVYWRPGVPSLPDIVYVYEDGEHLRRGEVVRARY